MGLRPVGRKAATWTPDFQSWRHTTDGDACSRFTDGAAEVQFPPPLNQVASERSYRTASWDRPYFPSLQMGKLSPVESSAQAGQRLVPLVPEAGPGSRPSKSDYSALGDGPEREGAHLLLLLSQAVPHGGHDFGHIPEGRAGVLSLDGGLSVSEEECVG